MAGRTARRAGAGKRKRGRASSRSRGAGRDRSSESPVSWRYRACELVLACAVLAVVCLAALGEVAGATHSAWVVAALLGAALLGVVVVVGLEKLRGSTRGIWRHLINGSALAGVLSLAWVSPPGRAVHNLEILVDHERATQSRVVRHQVYATYRRMDLAGQRMILERSRVFEPTIEEAAEAFGVSHELLMGIASTESGFHPRPSSDGGRGLFQITAVPAAAEEEVRRVLGVRRLDPVNQRHNAYLAAATLTLYAREMKDDLLLALLAYNMGPRNGGLRYVLDAYGAQNFSQAQPYLQELPRDYPIRVLSAALAYRLWKQSGGLPRYEEGEGFSARRIQRVGIPGLDGASPFSGYRD